MFGKRNNKYRSEKLKRSFLVEHFINFTDYDEPSTAKFPSYSQNLSEHVMSNLRKPRCHFENH